MPRLALTWTGARTIAVAFALLAVAAVTSAQEAPALPQGVASGDVLPDAAVVWARLNRAAPVRIEVARDTSFAAARRYGPAAASAEADFTVKLDATALAPDTRYVYRVVAGDAPVGPIGTFATAPAPGAEAAFTFAFSADTEAGFKPFREFAAVASQSPAFFLYLGDTIYSDFGQVRALTLDQYRAKYRENRDDPSLRAMLEAVPVYVTWDDHEVENDFNREHPRISIGRQAFFEYWPLRPNPEDPARIYRSFQWGRRAEFFVLDTRQYRSRQFEADTPQKTMVGAQQKAWLLDGLRTSQATWKFIVTSVGWAYHGADSWEGYTTERDEIARAITSQGIRNVVLLAGDVHYAAFVVFANGLVEAIAGPIGAILPNRPPRLASMPETRWSRIGVRNFAVVRVAASAVEVEWRDADNTVLHRERVEARP